jgi:hypothetical protein
MSRGRGQGLLISGTAGRQAEEGSRCCVNVEAIAWRWGAGLALACAPADDPIATV